MSKTFFKTEKQYLCKKIYSSKSKSLCFIITVEKNKLPNIILNLNMILL